MEHKKFESAFYDPAHLHSTDNPEKYWDGSRFASCYGPYRCKWNVLDYCITFYAGCGICT